jgi:hypothetical protein
MYPMDYLLMVNLTAPVSAGSTYSVLNGWWVNNELERTCREAV